MSITTTRTPVENLIKYKLEFEKVFSVHLGRFIDMFGFNINEFDKFLTEQGYDMKEHGAMIEYVRNKYGEDAVKLIMKVIDYNIT